MSWSAKLAKPLKPREHAELRTLADARAYMLELPRNLASYRAWQRAAELVLAAAESPSSAAIAEATKQLELAMLLTARTEMPAVEASKREKAPPPR